MGGRNVHEGDDGPGDLVLLHVGDKILEDEGEGLTSDEAVGSGGEAPGAGLPILGQTGQVIVGDVVHTPEEAARWCHLTSSVKVKVVLFLSLLLFLCQCLWPKVLANKCFKITTSLYR